MIKNAVATKRNNGCDGMARYALENSSPMNGRRISFSFVFAFDRVVVVDDDDGDEVHIFFSTFFLSWTLEVKNN